MLEDPAPPEARQPGALRTALQSRAGWPYVDLRLGTSSVKPGLKCFSPKRYRPAGAALFSVAAPGGAAHQVIGEGKDSGSARAPPPSKCAPAGWGGGTPRPAPVWSAAKSPEEPWGTGFPT